MSTTARFELWDWKTRNLVFDFDRLDEALHALRDLVDQNGAEAVDGLALLAVTDDDEVSLTLAEDHQLVDLLSAAAAPR